MIHKYFSRQRVFSGHSKRGLFPMGALWVSLGGFMVFYLIPFFISAVYAFTDNPVRMHFVGAQNFIGLFQNRFFLLGFKNTILFMILAIPAGMFLSLLLALGIKKANHFSGVLTLLFLVPLVLPSATIAQFWLETYLRVWNGVRELFGGTRVMEMGEWGSRWFMVSVYVWKYTGYNMVLFQAGLYAIPEEYEQCAAVLGANIWQKFWYVTRVYMTPVSFIVFIMSFVNSFKIFREIYFVYGGYPAEGMYLIQHFMNSTLLSIHYHKLVCAVYILTMLIVTIVAVTFAGQRRVLQNLSD